MAIKKRKVDNSPEAKAKREAEAKRMKNPSYRAKKAKKAAEYRKKNASKIKKYNKAYQKLRKR